MGREEGGVNNRSKKHITGLSLNEESAGREEGEEKASYYRGTTKWGVKNGECWT